jgi:hypothetical protein
VISFKKQTDTRVHIVMQVFVFVAIFYASRDNFGVCGFMENFFTFGDCRI